MNQEIREQRGVKWTRRGLAKRLRLPAARGRDKKVVSPCSHVYIAARFSSISYAATLQAGIETHVLTWTGITLKISLCIVFPLNNLDMIDLCYFEVRPTSSPITF